MITRILVVWGGIIGDEENYAYLEAHWRAMLANPLPGKPPLKRFRLYHCKTGKCEFDTYNLAERDRLRYLCREIIVKSGFAPVAHGVDVKAWNKLVTGARRVQMGAPERLAFGLCCKEVIRTAREYGMPAAAVFDQGREAQVVSIMDAVRLLDPEISEIVHYGWSSCASNVGLQAADTVANEFYSFGSRYVLDRSAAPSVHLKQFLESLGKQDGRFYSWISTEKAIMELLAKMPPLDGDAPGESS